MPRERKHVEAILDLAKEAIPSHLCESRCVDCEQDSRLINAIHIALSACDESPWRSMESAPKDGTNILLCEGANVSEGGWLTGAMQGAEDEACAGWWSVGCIENPTHWMPLPAAPEEE